MNEPGTTNAPADRGTPSGRVPRTAADAPDPAASDLLATLRRNLATRVASGRGGYVELLDQARRDLADLADPDEPEDVRTALPGLVASALAGHARRGRRRPSRTDTERLTRAFRALDACGITAREEFRCCSTCARAELGGVAEAAGARGYAFYHWQDAEVAAAGGALAVGFESRHPLRRAAVGEEVAEVLRAHGLTVRWDGDPDRRLEIAMDWDRRRHGRLAAFPEPEDPSEPRLTVAFTNPGPYRLPGWLTRYEGRVAVSDLARMVLPWLPAGVVAAVTGAGGAEARIERDFGLLRVAGGPELPRDRVEEYLGRWAVCGTWPPPASPDRGGVLDVTYFDASGEGSVDSPEPMDGTAARDLLYRLTPVEGTFAVFTAHTGAVVQMMWESGMRLWMEELSDGGSAAGRHVSLPEAEEVVRVLDAEGRSALAALGELGPPAW